MRFTNTCLLLLMVCACTGNHEPPPADGTCNDVAYNVLRLCLNSTDDATCEGVYSEAFDSCWTEVHSGRDVCVRGYRGKCEAVVLRMEEP